MSKFQLEAEPIAVKTLRRNRIRNVQQGKSLLDHWGLFFDSSCLNESELANDRS
ncbi:MAG: hypothetical protein ABR987_10225 [Terracidiphilus sp.]|jgi:hypothetical protein